MKNNINQKVEVFDMVAFKDLIIVFSGACLLFAILSFMKGEIRYTVTFVIMFLMGLIIYQAIIPSPLSWNKAVVLLIILTLILIASIEPSSLNEFIKKIPVLSSGK